MHVKRIVTIPKMQDDQPFADDLDIIGHRQFSKRHMIFDFRFSEHQAIGKNPVGYTCSDIQTGDLIYLVEHISGDDWLLVYNTQYVKRKVQANNRFKTVKGRVAL